MRGDPSARGWRCFRLSKRPVAQITVLGTVARGPKRERTQLTQSILQRIAGGEADAVRDCIQQFGGLVWSLARQFSRTPSDAEDAAQEIFLQIWRQASRFDASLVSEKTFIAMIARRRLIDRLRKAAARPPMDSSDEVFESLAWSEPGTASDTCFEAEQALQALAQLRPEYRQVLELRNTAGVQP